MTMKTTQTSEKFFTLGKFVAAKIVGKPTSRPTEIQHSGSSILERKHASSPTKKHISVLQHSRVSAFHLRTMDTAVGSDLHIHTYKSICMMGLNMEVEQIII